MNLSVQFSPFDMSVPTKVDLDKEALEVQLLRGMRTIPIGAGVPFLTLPCLHQVSTSLLFFGNFFPSLVFFPVLLGSHNRS